MPTALELSRADWKPYIEAASRRPQPPELTREERLARERLRARIREAATMLRTHFGVRRVVLFGSLAHAAWFMPDSDVDLAVEGLAGEVYWEAWEKVEQIIDDRPVDLIEIEMARESLRQAIEKRGVEL